MEHRVRAMRESPVAGLGAVALAVGLGLLVSCGGDREPDVPEGAVAVGPFYVIEDDGVEFDELATVCDAEAVDNGGSLLPGTPFESRLFPDFTRIFRCVDDGRVTAAVVRSSPAYRRYEFRGLPIVEWPALGDSEFTELEIDRMETLLIAQTVPDIVGHSAAIYVIEEFPAGDDPGRLAELRFVSPERAVCFMRQILDLDLPGPCEGP